MEVIDKKVLIKEAKPGLADLVFSVKNLPKSILFDKNGDLHRGIKKSQTGDNGFVFEQYDREGSDRLKMLDRYIDSIWPRTKSLPKRIPNQSVVGLGSSPALTMPQLEERIENDYGVRFLNLPIPQDEDVPSFENVTEAKHVVKTFHDDEYFDPDTKKIPKMPVEEKPVPVLDPFKCLGCNFVGFNKQSLAGHIRHHHSPKKKKEEAAAISSG